MSVLKFLYPVLRSFVQKKVSQLDIPKNIKTYPYLSSMVERFGFLHKLFFKPFFKHVETLEEDITKIKEISAKAPIIFVMKNKGQLEYRYFNDLFLKNKIPLIKFANKYTTLFWWPLQDVYKHILIKIYFFYETIRRKKEEAKNPTPVEPAPVNLSDQQKQIDIFENLISKKENTLINLTISQNYLFGFSKQNPLNVLAPVLLAQRKTETPIYIVPLQFLYDKHPDTMKASYIDLLFGPKSNPGVFRKLFLYLKSLISLRRRPQAKFGQAFALKEFIDQNQHLSEEDLSVKIFDHIKEILRIEQARITGPRLKPKEDIIRDVLNDPQLQKVIAEIAAQKKKPVSSLQKNVKQYLNEIAADVNYTHVQFLEITLKWVWENIFDGWVANESGLNKVRQVAGEHPVVLVPMHRSHIDYLLLNYIFYVTNITFPHICAGINLNFWPAGRIIRKAGGFFIRRSFKNNDLYKESLYGYIKALVTMGHCIEFFIEGTRSRTGKLLKPKMGILNLLIKTFTEKTVKDIYFVPIAITYDTIPEQKAYESESRGAEKSKENASELLKARSLLKRKYGKVYIQFGDPISLKNYQQEKNAQVAEPLSQKKLVEDFAYHLTYNINKNAIVTPISLVSLALLSGPQQSLTFETITKKIQLFKEYLDYKEVIYSNLIHYNESWAYGEALEKLTANHCIKKINTFEESFYTIENNRRTDMDYYKNNVLHFFVSLNCFCKILNHAPQNQVVSIEETIKQYEMIKTFFAQDFTFSQRASLQEHLKKVMLFCENKGFIRLNHQTYEFERTVHQANINDFEVYHGLLDNFLESHLITLRYLRKNRFQNLDKKVIIKDILEKSQNIYLKGDLKFPEALSRFNIENSLYVFVDIGILTTQEQKNTIKYSTVNDSDSIETWLEFLKNNLVVNKTWQTATGSSHLITVENQKELH